MRLLVPLLFVVILTGCDSANYTVIAEVRSPDSTIAAMLIQRRGHEALSADVYYVILTDSSKAVSLSKAVHDNPVLVTTNGQGLLLRWEGTNGLAVICSNCGLQQIDVMEKKPRWNSVMINYYGLPAVN